MSEESKQSVRLVELDGWLSKLSRTNVLVAIFLYWIGAYDSYNDEPSS